MDESSIHAWTFLRTQLPHFSPQCSFSAEMHYIILKSTVVKVFELKTFLSFHGYPLSSAIECNIFTFTFMHLADAFIQSDFQAIHLYCQYTNVYCICNIYVQYMQQNNILSSEFETITNHGMPSNPHYIKALPREILMSNFCHVNYKWAVQGFQLTKPFCPMSLCVTIHTIISLDDFIVCLRFISILSITLYQNIPR